ncbi:MAG: molybdopterin-dependent oxidoreductase [Planctomycetota bacterium]
MADNEYGRDVPDKTRRHATGCQYCAVGCGYNAILVPLKAGAQDAEDTEPTPNCSGEKKALEGVSRFITPAMRNTVRLQGKRHAAAVVPDVRCDLNKGNHSVRGGSQGENLVTHDGRGRSTRDRLKSPMVRLSDGQLHEIDWTTLNRVMSELVIAAADVQVDSTNPKKIRVHRPAGLGVKLYEYQYLENTFAATKFFYSAIGTPNLAYHDRPSAASSSPALEDAGMRPHDFAYDDLRHADMIFMIGTNPYENQSVAFMQYCVGKEMLVLDPRRTATAQYANETGGLHLQSAKDGTTVAGVDSLVIYAFCREILTLAPDLTTEWPQRHDGDDDYGRQWQLATNDQVAANKNLGPANVRPGSKQEQARKRKATRTGTLQDFKGFLRIGDEDSPYTLANASRLSGISEADLRDAVERMLGETGHRPKVAILYEKGIIWGFNYHGIAAIASLGLLLGAYSEKGRLVGRVGGHQKGWAESRADLSDLFENTVSANQHDPSEGYPFRNVSDSYTDANLQSANFGFENPQDIPESEREAVIQKSTATEILIHHNLDLHVFGPPPEMNPVDIGDGKVRLDNGVTTVAKPDVNLLWIIGGNYLGQTNDAARKRSVLETRMKQGGMANRVDRPSTAQADAIITTLKRRIESGGLVVVHQEIFANPTTEHADLVIPATGWGEENTVRYNAERRLKLYGRFQDPPLHGSDQERIGDSDPLAVMHRPNTYRHSPKPDWRIIRDIARQIGRTLDGANGGYFYNKLSDNRQNYFPWDSSAQVADDMAIWSHRGLIATGKNSSMLGDLYLFGVKLGLKADTAKQSGILHQVLGVGIDGLPADGAVARFLTNKPVDGQPGYQITGESTVYGNTVASNGVLLPAFVADEHGNAVDQPISLRGHAAPHSRAVRGATAARLASLHHLEGTLRVDRTERERAFFFVMADWDQIRPYFDRINHQGNSDNEVSLTNGRVNHLWNNLYHHIRNEYVNERYPEDMPGTLVELNHEWACERSIRNGQIIRIGTEAYSLLAIASLQDSVAPGSAFAMFSYPLGGRGEASFLAYANNVSDGYFDGVNPIAALKYGRATISKVANPHGSGEDYLFPDHFPHRVARLGPTFESRNQVRPAIGSHERMAAAERETWEMRERIVRVGLPRAFEHSFDEGRPDSFLSPDRFLSAFIASKDLRDLFLGFLSSMRVNFTDPNGNNALVDEWRPYDQEAAERWMETQSDDSGGGDGNGNGGENDTDGDDQGVDDPPISGGRFARVKQILDEAVDGNEFGSHGAFWRGLTRDQFVEKKLFGFVEIVTVGDGANSKLIQALRGIDIQQMPVGYPPVSEQNIRFIEQWIDDGCPNDAIIDTTPPDEPDAPDSGPPAAESSQHNRFWRDFDNWAMFHATEEIQNAVGRVFQLAPFWASFAKGELTEDQFSALANEDSVRIAIASLAEEQRQTVVSVYGASFNESDLVKSFELFGRGTAQQGLPLDDLRPADPHHQMNGPQMWFNWCTMMDAAHINDQLSPMPFWTLYARCLLIGLMNDGVVRGRFPVPGFSNPGPAVSTSIRAHVLGLDDSLLFNEMRSSFAATDFRLPF